MLPATDVARLTDGLVTLRSEAAGAPAPVLRWAVEREGVAAGTASLRPDGVGGAELHVELAPDARGRGSASRAVRLLLGWALTDGGYAVVHGSALAADLVARRVAWATGFTFSSTAPRLHRGGLAAAWTAWATEPGAPPTTRWLEPTVAETGRLRLRPWRDDDGPALVAASVDERIRHFVPFSPLPHDLAGVPAYLERIRLAAASGVRVAWCVADRETDEPLGNVAVFDFEGAEGEDSAQVGYWALPRARGRGVMSEAVRFTAERALSPAPGGLGVRRLYLLTAASNAASRRVAEHAGFTHVGIERAGGPVGGSFEDSALYDRLRDD